MLTHLYIEALLVDEDTADEIWEDWNKGYISDYWAAWMWRLQIPWSASQGLFLFRQMTR